MLMPAFWACGAFPPEFGAGYGEFENPFEISELPVFCKSFPTLAHRLPLPLANRPDFSGSNSQAGQVKA